MVNLVPGFVWHPIDVAGRAKRVKGRGAVGHVAVSNSANLVPSGTVASRSADWHWYNPKVGPGIQYIDLDLQCWASGAGNKTLAAFESQGGMGAAAQVNAEPWNANQIENAARFYAHLVKTEGAPLQVMPNSLPGSRGLAGHRHGIDPWRVSGGELWSSSRGKLCPGDAKMAQLPVIVSRAAEIVHGSPTPTVQEDEDMKLIQSSGRGPAVIGPGYFKELNAEEASNAAFLYGAPIAVADRSWDVMRAVCINGELMTAGSSLTEVYKAVIQGDGKGPGNNFAWLYNQIVPELAAIKADQGQAVAPAVDAAALAKALLADADAVAQLGDAIAAGLAARVHP